jgi:hypothetical protein
MTTAEPDLVVAAAPGAAVVVAVAVAAPVVAH